jgi:hypothetical protein
VGKAAAAAAASFNQPLHAREPMPDIFDEPMSPPPPPPAAADVVRATRAGATNKPVHPKGIKPPPMHNAAKTFFRMDVPPKGMPATASPLAKAGNSAVRAPTGGSQHHAIAYYEDEIAIIQPLQRVEVPGQPPMQVRMPHKRVVFAVLGIKYPYVGEKKFTRNMVDLQVLLGLFQTQGLDPAITVFGKLFNRCSVEQVIWLDCTSFAHVNQGYHRGTHDSCCARLVGQAREWQQLLNDFFNRLRSMEKSFLANEKPLVIVPYCDGGAHRSGAAASVLAYCLHQDKWSVCDKFLWLSKEHTELCDCAACTSSPLQRDGPHYFGAVQKFRETRRARLGF